MDKENDNKDLSIGDISALNAVIEKYEPQSSKGEPDLNPENSQYLHQ
jgi:hypothetical protein